MIVGVVSEGQEPVIFVEIFGSGDDSEFVRVVVDTGFTGALMLPQALIEQLALTPLTIAKLRLGDGTVVEMDEFSVEVVWHGHRKIVTAIASPGEALLGMRLLRGSKLSMDVVEGGELLIRPLAPPAP